MKETTLHYIFFFFVTFILIAVFLIVMKEEQEAIKLCYEMYNHSCNLTSIAP